MDTIKILEILRIVLGVMGAIPALWGLYDLVLGENHATSGANKKILGGIVFGSIAILIMNGVIEDVKEAQQMTGEVSYSKVQTFENNQIHMIDGYDEVENILKIS